MSKMFLSILILSIMISLNINTTAEDLSGENKSKQRLVKTMILEDFETPNTWTVKFSRFRTKSFKDTGVAFEPSEKWITWKKLPKENYDYYSKGEPYGFDGKEGTTVLGVRARFYSKGYNWIAIEPKQDMYMVGKIKAINFWVWGGNFDYDMYIVLKDFTGQLYTIHLGDLQFIGWHNISLNMSAYNVRQVDNTVPRFKPVQFVRFLLVSSRLAKEQMFGVWFDEIRYDTDLFEDRYLGKGLETEFDW